MLVCLCTNKVHVSVGCAAALMLMACVSSRLYRLAVLLLLTLPSLMNGRLTTVESS